MEKSDLDLLTQELRPAQHKWESIKDEHDPYVYGLISADIILRPYHDDGDRLKAMLKKQLQLSYPSTWRNIVDAVRSPRVRDPQLADQLEAKYCPSEFINNNILLYFSEYKVVQHCTRSTPHKV